MENCHFRPFLPSWVREFEYRKSANNNNYSTRDASLAEYSVPKVGEIDPKCLSSPITLPIQLGGKTEMKKHLIFYPTIKKYLYPFLGPSIILVSSTIIRNSSNETSRHFFVDKLCVCIIFFFQTYRLSSVFKKTKFPKNVIPQLIIILYFSLSWISLQFTMKLMMIFKIGQKY